MGVYKVLIVITVLCLLFIWLGVGYHRNLCIYISGTVCERLFHIQVFDQNCLLRSQKCWWSKPMECTSHCQPERSADSDCGLRMRGLSQCCYHNRWQNLFVGYVILNWWLSLC